MARTCHCHQNPAKQTRAQRRIARDTRGLLARAYEMFEDRIPPQWLPKLSNVEESASGLRAHIPKYGCGAYGCVFPTLDPNVVIKVTEDDTEAEFAGQISRSLAKPITVIYHEAMEIDPGLVGRRTFVLWREAAAHIGELPRFTPDPTYVRSIIEEQHKVAQRAYKLIQDGASPIRIREEITAWLAWWGNAKDEPGISELARGIVEVYQQNKVFFGDLHVGNLGLVTRSGVEHWVITDPGHVAVIDV